MPDKNKTDIKVDKERCKGCLLCVGVCPNKVFAVSEGVNEKGYRYMEVKFPEKCTGCGLCFIICPDSGIEIRPQTTDNRPQTKNEEKYEGL